MSTQLQQTQSYLLTHHGGDGDLAAKRTQDSHNRNHDEAFWKFWYQWTASILPPNGHLVDLGTGVGLFIQTMSQRFPKLAVTGIECASYMLENMVSLPANARVVIDDLNAPACLFPKSSIDTCIANMLVHELHQPLMLFSQVHQWLKPGGRFILVDMVRQPLESYLIHKHPDGTPLDRHQLEDSFQHFQEHNRYTADDLCFMLRHCGFRIDATETFKRGRAVRIAASTSQAEETIICS